MLYKVVDNFCFIIVSSVSSLTNVIYNIKLFWAETEDIEKEDGSITVEFTGRVEVFKRVITKEDIVFMLGKIINTIEDIKYWEYKDTEIEKEDAERYLFLKERQKEDKEEIELLKLKLESYLLNRKVNYGFSKNEENDYIIEFSLSERSVKEYPEEILTKEQKYKDEISYLKSLSDKKLTTKKTVSKSLRFKKVIKK